ncbi:MAG: amidohydrolase [Chloroflexi bacterium]|nr:amidohydrolase [Chloroflexota bacterium]
MNAMQWIDQNRDTLVGAADQVWDYAEILYRETQSAALLSGMLEEFGFKVKRGVAGIPTAFVAEYGHGGPVIGIMGEYDALPGLSQDRVPYRKPLQEGGNGHGCGHNLFGVACLGAAVAVKQAIDAGEVKGTVRFYGCPAEEGGSAKVFMVKAGLFKDADLCLTWHPGHLNQVSAANMLATAKVIFRFRGKTAHAAMDPYNGRSALDAVELMNVGANYLREHMISDARIHYIITNGGGAANVVPDFASSMYVVRAPKNSQVMELLERVQNVAKGAALMTGTEVEVEFGTATSNILLNDTIAEVLHDKLEVVTPPQFDAAETEFAAQLAKTFPKGSFETSLMMAGREGKQAAESLKRKVLADNVMPLVHDEMIFPASSDVGDVTWVVPTGQVTTACHAIGTPGHSWQLVAQGGMSIGHKGMLYAGKVLGAAALDFMQKPELLQKARTEFEARTKDSPYVCPIPDGVKPPLP